MRRIFGLRRLGRVFLLMSYFVGLLVAFGISGYLSFNGFVRRGVVPVPDLVGLPLQVAESLLVEKGLLPEHRLAEDRFDEVIPAGDVLQHDPAAGNRVKKGARIEIVLSRGRQLVEVPDLTGQAVQAAQVNLAASGLELGRLGNIFTQFGVPGTVVKQQPPGGSEVDQATVVDLLVAIDNTAEVYVMPDLVYRHDDTVRYFFQRHGFRLGSVKYEPYEGVEPGVILRQYPLAGHPLRRHDVISLVVAAPGHGET